RRAHGASLVAASIQCLASAGGSDASDSMAAASAGRLGSLAAVVAQATIRAASAVHLEPCRVWRGARLARADPPTAPADGAPVVCLADLAPVEPDPLLRSAGTFAGGP